MAAPSVRRWLVGPWTDLLVGCGGFYAAIFALSLLAGVTGPLASMGLAFPILVFLFSAPHYGATLLRVYEGAADRRRYSFFAVHATLAVIGAAVASLYSSTLASWMLTLYLTWSPWHYTGQNYGLAVMYLRRRGVEVDAPLKRAFHSTFVISYILTFFVMHTSTGLVDYVLVPQGGAQSVRFVSIGIPPGLSAIVVPLLVILYVGGLSYSAVRLLRMASGRDLVPTGVLVLTQGLWFTLPLAAQHWGIAQHLAPVGQDLRPYFVMWIAFGHAVQYLWITTYYARASERWRGWPVYYAKTLVAGRAAFLVPALLFSPVLVGGLTIDLGMALVVVAAVNLHHFILDGAIWKLRSGVIANVLIRNAPEETTQSDGRVAPRAAVRVAWAIGVAALIFGAWVTIEERYVYTAARARGDLEAAARSLDRLNAVGFSHEALRIELGVELLSRGLAGAARDQFQRSIEIRPTPEAYVGLGESLERFGDWPGAARAYEAGLTVEPDRLGLLHRSGEAWLRAGRPERALSLLERAVEIAPNHEPSRRALAAARQLGARSSERQGRKGADGAPD